jgi:hypothetical protein
LFFRLLHAARRRGNPDFAVARVVIIGCALFLGRNECNSRFNGNLPPRLAGTHKAF